MRASFLARSSFQQFLDGLRGQGYRVLGPRLQDGAVAWGDIERVTDLPVGWRDVQEPGRYRLTHEGSDRYFNVVNGPQAIKPLTFAAREPLLQIQRIGTRFSAQPTSPPQDRIAVLGARGCDLAGLAIQDHIFLEDAYRDPYYAARRSNLLLIAVNCTRAVSTCFCASAGTGPRVTSHADLTLTELDDGFLLESGSDAGRASLSGLPLTAALSGQEDEAAREIHDCADSQTRRMPQAPLPQALYAAHDHARWDDVAARCLACTNCTMVCPTCFCHTVTQSPDLSQTSTEHARLWDSCFTVDHGYIHGKNIRPTIKDRYRMWLTHKFASWIDQFGTSGCVGCGRCITWCPVGIDVTEELKALTEDRR